MIDKADIGLTQARKALDQRRYHDAHAACIDIIKRTPDHSQAIALLAEVAWRTKSHEKAFELFRKAHLIDPDLPGAVIGLAKSFALINNFIGAREAAERAVELHPSEPEQLHDLGLVFRFLTDERQALALFERAAAASPKTLKYIFDLGVSQQRIGDGDGAEQAMRQCLALDQSFLPAYSILVELRKQTVEHNFIPALEQLFAQAGDDFGRRLAIGHALAKSYEDTGDLEASISVLDRAKENKRKLKPYDFARTRDMFEQATRTFPSSPPAGAANPSDAPIFVFGMPRSGTTLTDRILSSHPLITSLGEIQSFAFATRELSNVSKATLDDPEVFRLAPSIDVGRLADAYLKQASSLLEPNRRFVDKYPYNFLFAGLIHRALPNARLICLRRDPVDVCLNNFRLHFERDAAFTDYAYSLADIGQYYLLFDQLMAHWSATLPPGRFMSLHYESLVTHQEAQTRRLLDFCGLPWDERCLAFHENSASVATPSLHQVRQPMFTSSIGRWRRYGESLRPLIDVLKQGGLLDEGGQSG